MELQVKNLCKAYRGVPVLRDVSFTAGAGVTCVMAPSGAGKTTLLRILLGLETADSGTVIGAENCRWAAVFQEDRLLEGLDALGNLRFVSGPPLDTAKAAALLEELGLEDVGGKPVRAFSGGMKRRLALARALLAESDALALDEPFTGLDGDNRARALSCVRRASAGKTVLLVTHDARDAADLSARVVTL
jgi:NitT/TauT family transport system ATP-binding protein